MFSCSALPPSSSIPDPRITLRRWPNHWTFGEPVDFKMTPRGHRTLDYIYLFFFATHIPVTLFIDLGGFWPEGTAPAFSQSLREYYIENFRDQFFIDPPIWFKGYMVMEGLYHLPLSIWMLSAILEGTAYYLGRSLVLTFAEHPLVPLHLLVFSVQIGMTTLTCLMEMFSWGYTRIDEMKLCSLYGPYLALAVVMGIDAFMRLRQGINAKVKHV